MGSDCCYTLSEKVGQPTNDVDGEDEDDQITDGAFVVSCIHSLLIVGGLNGVHYEKRRVKRRKYFTWNRIRQQDRGLFGERTCGRGTSF